MNQDELATAFRYAGMPIQFAAQVAEHIAGLGAGGGGGVTELSELPRLVAGHTYSASNQGTNWYVAAQDWRWADVFNMGAARLLNLADADIQITETDSGDHTITFDTIPPGNEDQTLWVRMLGSDTNLAYYLEVEADADGGVNMTLDVCPTSSADISAEVNFLLGPGSLQLVYGVENGDEDDVEVDEVLLEITVVDGLMGIIDDHRVNSGWSSILYGAPQPSEDDLTLISSGGFWVAGS